MSTSSMPTFLDILKDAYEQRRMERENAELKAENAALKIERNRYKVALEDIALANDQWPGYKAREVLSKEAQP